MKKYIRLSIIALTVTFIFTLTFSSIQIFAGENAITEVDNIEEVVDEVEEVDEVEVDEVDEDVDEKDKGKVKDKVKEHKIKEDNKKELMEEAKKEASEAKKLWKEAKDKLEAEKDIIEAQKDEIEAQKEVLEKQLKEAEEAGDSVLVEQLKQQVNQYKEQMATLKKDMKQIKIQMKEEIRNRYTPEELKVVSETTQELKSKYKDIKVLSVDCVIAKGKNFKFDTPPVIKEGRTLIPVRAITEGFGANVEWNAETQQVTITKGEQVIILVIGSGTAVVNGEEILIDSKSEILNGRTVVPLRFIIESFGLKVEWDDETETIEIEEEIEIDDNEMTEGLEKAVIEVETDIETETDIEAESDIETEDNTENDTVINSQD